MTSINFGNYFSDTCCKKIATRFYFCLKITNMDKRRENTISKIKQTYINMVVNKEAINVRALVRKANINKSTFYRYYTYIEELEDELITQLAEKIYIKSHNGGYDNFVENYFYVYEQVLTPEEKTLFRKHPHKITDSLVRIALSHFKDEYPDPNKQLILYIIATGCIALFLNNNYTREERRSAIISVGKSFKRFLDEK